MKNRVAIEFHIREMRSTKLLGSDVTGCSILCAAGMYGGTGSVHEVESGMMGRAMEGSTVNWFACVGSAMYRLG